MKQRFKNDSGQLQGSASASINPYLEEISIFSHTLNRKSIELKNKKNNINIAMAFNDRYIYPILVSMESVLSNSNKHESFITYHFLCCYNVTENTLSKIKSFLNRYPLNLEIIFYNMGNTFINLENTRLTQVAFYRLFLPILINIERILYLDGDTLTFKDLREMYNLDFNDTYIIGTLDYFSNGVDYLKLKSEKYINSGVLLINLEKLRNDKKYIELINIVNKVKLRHEDQTVINYILYPKIGILPYKYNIFTFYDKLDIKIYSDKLRTNVNISEIQEVLKDPTIIHYVICFPKLWNSNSQYNDNVSGCRQRHNCFCERSHKIWLSFANKTDFDKEILLRYKTE
jgi:lipopolysaccharide biosynthesis glycosyltransferase